MRTISYDSSGAPSRMLSTILYITMGSLHRYIHELLIGEQHSLPSARPPGWGGEGDGSASESAFGSAGFLLRAPFGKEKYASDERAAPSARDLVAGRFAQKKPRREPGTDAQRYTYSYVGACRLSRGVAIRRTVDERDRHLISL